MPGGPGERRRPPVLHQVPRQPRRLRRAARNGRLRARRHRGQPPEGPARVHPGRSSSHLPEPHPERAPGGAASAAVAVFVSREAVGWGAGGAGARRGAEGRGNGSAALGGAATRGGFAGLV